MLTTCLDGWWVGGWPGCRVALEEWKLRLTSAKVEVEVKAELGKKQFYIQNVQTFLKEDYIWSVDSWGLV